MDGERPFEILRLFWREDFCSGFWAAGEIDQERALQAVIKAPFIEQWLDVEQVARVLAREGSGELAGV